MRPSSARYAGAGRHAAMHAAVHLLGLHVLYAPCGASTYLRHARRVSAALRVECELSCAGVALNGVPC